MICHIFNLANKFQQTYYFETTRGQRTCVRIDRKYQYAIL